MLRPEHFLSNSRPWLWVRLLGAAQIHVAREAGSCPVFKSVRDSPLLRAMKLVVEFECSFVISLLCKNTWRCSIPVRRVFLNPRTESLIRKGLVMAFVSEPIPQLGFKVPLTQQSPCLIFSALSPLIHKYPILWPNSFTLSLVLDTALYLLLLCWI